MDVAGFGAHVRFQLERAVQVLVAAGTIGEAPLLSLTEKLALVRELRRITREDQGSAIAVAGASSDRPEDVVELTRAFREVGADAALVMVPPSLKLSEAEQWRFWTWFDERTHLPYVIYSTPHAASGPVSLELVQRLATLRHVIALKDAFADVDRLGALSTVLGGRIPLIGAAEKVLPDAVRAGIDGFMTSTSCFAPEVMWHLWDALRGAETDRADEIFQRVMYVRDVFQSDMDRGFPAFIAATRSACETRGLPAGLPRAPLPGLTEDQTSTLNERVEQLVSPPFATLPPAYAPTGNVRSSALTT